MGKNRFLILALLFLLISAISIRFDLSIGQEILPWTVDDDGPADFHSIQEAIDNVSSGDIIYVYNGTYNENITVSKTLTIIGESRSGTIINGSGIEHSGALVTIIADNVTMTGFSIIGAQGMGLLVESVRYCKIFDNIVCFAGNRGIVLRAGRDHEVFSNIVYNCSFYGGIESIWSDHNRIYSNLVFFNDWGISTNQGSYNLIYNNTVHSNNVGIHVDWPSILNVVSNNIIASNTLEGIAVLNNANGTEIRNNEILQSFCGIRLQGSYAAIISGNYIGHNFAAISVDHSENNSIYHNSFINNDFPVNIVTSGWNMWDNWGYPSGGNFWSDYEGIDLYSGQYQNETGSDGLGDTPVVFDANNTDRYPLMGTLVPFTRMTQIVSSESDLASQRPSVAVDFAGVVHVAWHDLTDFGGSGSDWDIFYKRFKAGMGWSNTEVVSADSTSASTFPSIAVDAVGNVHIAWSDLTDYAGSGSDSDIFYRKFDVDERWLATEVVSTESTASSSQPALALDSEGDVHAVWRDLTDYDGAGADYDVFYKTRTELGWNSTEVVSTESNSSSSSPSIAVDSIGNVHVAWEDESPYNSSGSDSDIFYKVRILGASWLTTEIVSTESTHNSYSPSIAADPSDCIHVAWEDYSALQGSGNDSDIFYKKLQTGEVNWTSTEVVSTESTSTSSSPSLDVDFSGNVHVAWDDLTNYTECGSDWDVFYKRFEVGEGWTLTEVVSAESTSHSRSPSLVVDYSGNVHIAWEDLTPYGGCGADSDIFYRYIGIFSTRYPWPMFRYSNKNIGFSETPAPNTNEMLWNYTTGGEVVSSPAIADGRVYVGSYDNRTYCFDAITGAQIWNYTTGDSIHSSPAVSEGRVYVGSMDGSVYCLDGATGIHIWNYTIGGINYTKYSEVVSSPAIADGRVYVGSNDHVLRCIDAISGVHIWNFSTGGMVVSSPAVSEGRVYVGSMDGSVYCLDGATGIHIWNYTTSGEVVSSPAIADGRVYVGSFHGKIYCLDASTGTHIWNYTVEEVAQVESSPAVAYGKVYVGSDWYSVYCLNASTGLQVWEYVTGDMVVSSPAVADGKVYVGSLDNHTYCLDAFTGVQIWNYTTSGIVRSSPAVADGIVYVGSDDHRLYAFGGIIRVPEDYSTLQEAVDAADPEDTIIVGAGIYYETVVVNKTLTIIGKLGSDPIFDGGGSGVAVTLLPGASGSTVAGFTITNYDQGVLILGSTNCTIYNNVMSNMGSNGVSINGSGAIYNLVHSNSFQNSTVGVDCVESSNNNVIYHNVIQFNTIGINVESSGNTIYGNSLSSNDVGIDLTGSSGNTIYWNNFIDNDVQLVLGSSVSVWDNGYPDGGNFWSTHLGVDLYSGPSQSDPGPDGISDIPYTIDASNEDRYPLMSPWTPPQHNIAILNIAPSKTVVGEGFKLSVGIMLENEGEIIQTFSLAVLANAASVNITETILLSESVASVALEWDTVGYAKGNYLIGATAQPVMGEINLDDNNSTDGWIMITVPGDVNGDKIVDIFDAILLAGAFGATPGTPTWSANSDVNGDNNVDIFDAIILAGNFGNSW